MSFLLSDMEEYVMNKIKEAINELEKDLIIIKEDYGKHHAKLEKVRAIINEADHHFYSESRSKLINAIREVLEED